MTGSGAHSVSVRINTNDPDDPFVTPFDMQRAQWLWDTWPGRLQKESHRSLRDLFSLC